MDFAQIRAAVATTCWHTVPVREWVERSPYSRALGVELVESNEENCRLVLPYREENSNPGGVLHGGCAASLGLIGGHVVAHRALGEAAGTLQTASSHVSYLSAAIGEDVIATTVLTRKGKAASFAETSVTTRDGTPVSQVSTVLTRRSDDDAPALRFATSRDEGADPGPLGAFVGTMPFTAARRMSVEHMAEGRSRLVMSLADANADLGGSFHEGALLALVDTTGAMAAWAVTGPGPFRASTVAIQSCMLTTARGDRLVGRGHVVHRAGELFWAAVEVADAGSERIAATGTVVYRIAT
jgi:uncharacterized protein (TIGR00369 family)